MEIRCGNCILRDPKEKDIEDDIYWNTVETAWQNWDAPWEKGVPFDAHAYRRKALAQLAVKKDESATRFTLEIDFEGKHIGGVNTYFIDGNYRFAKEGLLTIGIDICEPAFWGRGIGTAALSAFTTYLFEKGHHPLYTQTWAGNERMVRTAEKLGFSLCHREEHARMVDGLPHDDLTFRLLRQGDGKP